MHGPNDLPPEWEGDTTIETHIWDPVWTELAPPTAGAFDEPTVCVEINRFWVSHLMGVIQRLAWGDAWLGTGPEKDAAVQNIYFIMDALAEGNCPVSALESQSCCSITTIKNYEEQTTIINNDLSTYDGDITNITNQWTYDSSPKDVDRNIVLCLALQAFTSSLAAAAEPQIVRSNAGIVDALRDIQDGTAALGFMLAVGAAFGVATVSPLLALGVAVTSGIADKLADWLDVEEEVLLNDDYASTLACCMYDSLRDQTPTFTNWCNSLAACTIPVAAEPLRDAIAATICTDAIFVQFFKATAEAVLVAEYLGQYDPCQCDDCSTFTVSNGPTDILATQFLPGSLSTQTECEVTMHNFAAGRVSHDFGEDVCLSRVQVFFHPQSGVQEHYWALVGDTLFDCGIGGPVGPCLLADSGNVPNDTPGRFLTIWATDELVDPGDPQGTLIPMRFHRIDQLTWNTEP